MELRTVEFYNFGPFRGLQKLDVDPKQGLEHRPLILVRAYNDVGKSSILKAFNFCLYGFGSNFSSTKTSERARAINRQAAFEKDGRMYVKIKFRSGGDDYSIIRSINFKKVKIFADEPKIDKYTCEISKNENVLFDQDTNPTGFWNDVENFIEDILPYDISQFFFFDGEKIQNYAQEQPTPAITTAVQKILGIKQILNAKADAEKNLPELNSKLTDAQLDDAENRERAKELQQEKENNVNLQKKMEEDLITINSLEENMRNNAAIIDSVAGIKEEWDKKKQLEREKIKLRDELKKSHEERKQFNDGKLLSYILSLKFNPTDSESNQIPQYVSKTSKWCIDRNDCLCERGITPDVSDKLQKMIASGTKSKESAESYMYSEITRKYGQTLPETLSALSMHASDLDEQIQINEDALTKIKEKIGDATESEEEKIKDAKTQYDQDYETKMKLQVTYEMDLEKYEKKKKELEREDEELTSRSKSDKVRIAQAHVIRCRQIISALSEIIDDQVESERNSIQQKMSEYFLSITNKPQVYREVLLDENYRIQLRVPAGVVDVWKLGASSGASAMISFAFIAALNNKASKQGPIVIDTPTGRLDPIHADNIIKFWPNFGKQVIILYQPNEISDQKLVELENLIAYHYECKLRINAEEESYLIPFGDER